MNRDKQIVTLLYNENDKIIREAYTLLLTFLAKKIYPDSDCNEGLAIFKEFLPGVVIL